MKTASWMAWSVLLLASGSAGCASIPGKTGEEQAENMDTLVERTLADLYEKEPSAKEAIASSVGYIVMSNKITKIPFVGAGGGYGVAIETKTGARTYLEMARFDVGMGWGARSLRPVAIFTDAKAFKDMTDGEWDAQAGAEAAAKVGEGGGAGGAGGGPGKKGYTMYVITDAGVSATATAGIVHLKPVKLKK